MTEVRKSIKIPPAAYDDAGEWFVRHREGDLDDRERQAFDAWLRASPHNVQAYLEISSTWEDIPQLDAAGNPSAAELLAANDGQANVVVLGRAAPLRATHSTSASRRFGTARAKWTIAASVVACAGLAAWLWVQRAPVYVTDIGEQRSIVLPDGSRLQLNSRSRVELHFSETERRVDLVEGQVLFDVRPDTQRPFLVSSGDTQVRVLGTQFDVYRKGDQTIVTVLQGRVSVTPDSALARPLTAPGSHSNEANIQPAVLSAGEQLAVRQAAKGAATPVQPSKIDVAAATAWTQGRLVFQSSPLREVVEEFNRYNGRQLRINDAALEPYRISGVFSSTDPEALLAFLRLQRGMRVTESDAEIEIAQK